MKAFKMTLLISVLFTVIACNSSQVSVPGTYVMSFKNEYSMAEDTLHIDEYNSDAGSYKIERRDGFRRIRNGKVLQKEFRRESWIATYDQGKQVLQETAYGRQVYFKGDGHSLSLGGTYNKLK